MVYRAYVKACRRPFQREIRNRRIRFLLRIGRNRFFGHAELFGYICFVSATKLICTVLYYYAHLYITIEIQSLQMTRCTCDKVKFYNFGQLYSIQWINDNISRLTQSVEHDDVVRPDACRMFDKFWRGHSIGMVHLRQDSHIWPLYERPVSHAKC